MGNRRFQKIESLHALGTREPERLKVTALNLFHPTAPPPFQNVGSWILRHSHSGGGLGCELIVKTYRVDFLFKVLRKDQLGKRNRYVMDSQLKKEQVRENS